MEFVNYNNVIGRLVNWIVRLLVGLWNWRIVIVELVNCGIGELWNCGIVGLWNW